MQEFHVLEEALKNSITRHDAKSVMCLIKCIKKFKPNADDLQNFPSLSKTDEQGRSFLLYALEKGTKGIAQEFLTTYPWERDFIFRADNDGRICLHMAAARGFLEIFKTLTKIYEQKWTDQLFFHRDNNGACVLHYAISNHLPKNTVLAYLLEIIRKNGNRQEIMHWVNKQGETALHCALKHGSSTKLFDSAIELINNEASLNLPDNEGRTAFDLFFQLTEYQQKNIFAALNQERQALILRHYREMLDTRPDKKIEEIYFTLCGLHKLESLILAHADFNKISLNLTPHLSEKMSAYKEKVQMKLGAPAENNLTLAKPSNFELLSRERLSLLEFIDQVRDSLTNLQTKPRVSYPKNALVISSLLCILLSCTPIVAWLIYTLVKDPNGKTYEFFPLSNFGTAMIGIAIEAVVFLIVHGLSLAFLWNQEATLSENDFRVLIDKLENNLLKKLKTETVETQSFLQSQTQNIADLEVQIAALKQVQVISTKEQVLLSLETIIRKIQEAISIFPEAITLFSRAAEDQLDQCAILLPMTSTDEGKEKSYSNNKVRFFSFASSQEPTYGRLEVIDQDDLENQSDEELAFII